MVSSPTTKTKAVARQNDIGSHKGQAFHSPRDYLDSDCRHWDKPLNSITFPCETRLWTRVTGINQDHICWDHVASTPVCHITDISLIGISCSDPHPERSLYWAIIRDRLLAALSLRNSWMGGSHLNQDQDHNDDRGRWILFTWFC